MGLGPSRRFAFSHKVPNDAFGDRPLPSFVLAEDHGKRWFEVHDLDPSAVGNDVYDSYVEAAVRRFQARHGLNIDGIVHQPTLIALNVPAPTRRDQLKVNIGRLKTLATLHNTGYQTLLKEFVVERLYEEEKRAGIIDP